MTNLRMCLSIPLKSFELTEVEIAQIDIEYQKNYDYAKLIKEYKQDKQRCRQKSFPSRKEWIPSAGMLSPIEHAYLQGPESEGTLLRRFSVKDKNTGRFITYKPSTLESKVSREFRHPMYQLQGKVLHLPSLVGLA